VLRMLERYGQLPSPELLKEWSKTDPNLPPPAALARYAASFEPPSVDEGFASITEVPFVREPGSALTGTQKALLLDVDGTLRTTKSGALYPVTPDDIEILPNRQAVLERYVADGWQLFLVSNQSGIASGNLTTEDAEACFQRTVQALGVPVQAVRYCPHPAFPVGCFCRKPLPGMGVALMREFALSRERSIMVGDLPSDAEFAKALGVRYVDANEFFA
jgi:HAD superfamily hydrolase (TIGR01662 family)